MPICSERLSVNVALDVAAAGVGFVGIDVDDAALAAFELIESDVDVKFVVDVVVVVVAVELLSIVVDGGGSSVVLLLTELDVAFAVELFKLVILCVCACEYEYFV